MAPRLPPTTRRLFATCGPLQRSTASLRLSPLSAAQLEPSHQARIVQANSNRTISTTTPRPWLLSALPNLAPGTSNNPPPPKTLRARRTLPYPPAQIYILIADIDSYTHFLPHCPHSRVTRWVSTPTSAAASTPTPSGQQGQAPEQQQQQQQHNGREKSQGQDTTRRHPAQADLTVGWGPFTQTYTSRVYCVPGSVVEAVSGAADTTIPWETLRAVGYNNNNNEKQNGGGEKMEGIFESLVTRWTVRPVPSSSPSSPAAEWTEVTLSVTFQFANPALGFAVGQLADEKVNEMVEAFEGRARALFGNGR